MIRFQLDASDGTARAGRIDTPHGEVQTPAFMPVATQATVKALSPDEVSNTGAQMVIMNTYHLWVRPGPEVIARHGGLHQFSRISHAIATDSGGFQAFSLADRVRVDEDGFEFASHLDGRRLRLSPEESMRIQGLLGSDIAMQLDVCPPASAPETELAAAIARTTRWAERCLAAKRADQGLFGIIQGGTNVKLRLAHAEAMAKLPVDGLALGGFSVGEPPKAMHEALAAIVPHVDAQRPRYLMGVGTPVDLLQAIASGIDLFDCVLPTRNARNGQAFVTSGRLVLKHAVFRDDLSPLETGCACPTCTTGYSRAYLRHLCLAKEILFYKLLSIHNLFHFQQLVRDARAAIFQGRFAEFRRERLRRLSIEETP